MSGDRFDEWDRLRVDKARERLEYRRLAWYSAPWGDAGIAVVVLALLLDVVHRLGRQVVRLAARLKLV